MCLCSHLLMLLALHLVRQRLCKVKRAAGRGGALQGGGKRLNGLMKGPGAVQTRHALGHTPDGCATVSLRLGQRMHFNHGFVACALRPLPCVPPGAALFICRLA